MAFENLPESALSEAKKAGKKINNQINLGNPYAVGAIPPVRGTITSFNNQDYNVIGGDIRNYGIDIAAPSGTPIVAPFHNMRLVAWDQDWVSSRSGKTSSAGFIVLRATLPSGDEIDCRFMHLEPDSVRQFAKEYTGRETKQGSIPVDSQRPIIQQGATIGKIVDIDRYKATNGIDMFMTGPHLDFMISPVKSNKHSALSTVNGHWGASGIVSDQISRDPLLYLKDYYNPNTDQLGANKTSGTQARSQIPQR